MEIEIVSNGLSSKGMAGKLLKLFSCINLGISKFDNLVLFSNYYYLNI